MGTKNEPGKFDCYDKAEPDEPMFVLLARDPLAPVLVAQWADLAEAQGTDQDKVLEALDCAAKMEQWRRVNR